VFFFEKISSYNDKLILSADRRLFNKSTSIIRCCGSSGSGLALGGEGWLAKPVAAFRACPGKVANGGNASKWLAGNVRH
jgi:hypothetical protein